MSVYQFALKEVACQGCINAIDKALTRAGFDQHELDLETRKATVTTDSDAKDVINVIEDAGYGAEQLN